MSVQHYAKGFSRRQTPGKALRVRTEEPDRDWDTPLRR